MPTMMIFANRQTHTGRPVIFRLAKFHSEIFNLNQIFNKSGIKMNKFSIGFIMQ